MLTMEDSATWYTNMADLGEAGKRQFLKKATEGMYIEIMLQNCQNTIRFGCPQRRKVAEGDLW